MCGLGDVRLAVDGELVLVAMLAAITLLPGLLGLAGTKIDNRFNGPIVVVVDVPTPSDQVAVNRVRDALPADRVARG